MTMIRRLVRNVSKGLVRFSGLRLVKRLVDRNHFSSALLDKYLNSLGFSSSEWEEYLALNSRSEPTDQSNTDDLFFEYLAELGFSETGFEQFCFEERVRDKRFRNLKTLKGFLSAYPESFFEFNTNQTICCSRMTGKPFYMHSNCFDTNCDQNSDPICESNDSDLMEIEPLDRYRIGFRVRGFGFDTTFTIIRHYSRVLPPFH